MSMESSRRAVESYWRSRMIDGATSDEDKVAPVYKLEEICELLRSSHVSIVKEVSEFVIKRLDHKSPIVKQKALRLIKYVVGKSGVEFRREMQRNSASVRQLIHYKGQLDPLKGDALNKAVRTTAQEALSALFSTEDNKPAPAEDLTQRIQGFGNTNYEMPSEDRKSFISEVVGIGSATIMQGLNSLSHAPSLKKNDTGSYRSPNLRRSLTTETNYSDRYEGVEDHSATRSASQFSKGGTWGNDTSDGNSSSSYVENKTREERLLETVVTSGGVRLQPTRDALQVFLVEASKLDALALSHALESKLQSHLWQVRVKAVCVLEAVLRKKDDDFFSIIESYFAENKDAVMKCSESPQASLREKANKVLTLLDGESTNGRAGHPEKLVKPETAVFQMPDLIDTGDKDDLSGNENSIKTTTTVDDLFGDSLGIGVSTREQKNDDDPFADVSFHINNDKEHGADLFSGMTVDKTATAEFHMSTNKSEPELFDVFGSTPALPLEQAYNKKDVNDLMDGLSINENSSLVEPNGASLGGLSESIFSDSTTKPSHSIPNDVLSGILGSQATGINANPMFPSGPMAYNLSAGLMFNPAFASQQINYGALGNLFAQQQFMAATSNFQQMGNVHPQNAGVSTEGGGYSSPLPDIFNPSLPTQNPSPMMNSLKKEDTRAFDFISDHIQAARDPKRVI